MKSGKVSHEFQVTLYVDDEVLATALDGKADPCTRDSFITHKVMEALIGLDMVHRVIVTKV